jgi:hypothetical protein
MICCGDKFHANIINTIMIIVLQLRDAFLSLVITYSHPFHPAMVTAD